MIHFMYNGMIVLDSFIIPLLVYYFIKKLNPSLQWENLATFIFLLLFAIFAGLAFSFLDIKFNYHFWLLFSLVLYIIYICIINIDNSVFSTLCAKIYQPEAEPSRYALYHASKAYISSSPCLSLAGIAFLLVLTVYAFNTTILQSGRTPQEDNIISLLNSDFKIINKDIPLNPKNDNIGVLVFADTSGSMNDNNSNERLTEDLEKIKSMIKQLTSNESYIYTFNSKTTKSEWDSDWNSNIKPNKKITTTDLCSITTQLQTNPFSVQHDIMQIYIVSDFKPENSDCTYAGFKDNLKQMMIDGITPSFTLINTAAQAKTNNNHNIETDGNITTINGSKDYIKTLSTYNSDDSIELYGSPDKQEISNNIDFHTKIKTIRLTGQDISNVKIDGNAYKMGDEHTLNSNSVKISFPNVDTSNISVELVADKNWTQTYKAKISVIKIPSVKDIRILKILWTVIGCLFALFLIKFPLFIKSNSKKCIDCYDKLSKTSH